MSFQTKKNKMRMEVHFQEEEEGRTKTTSKHRTIAQIQTSIIVILAIAPREDALEGAPTLL